MSIFLEAFLDGVTGAGLFGKLRRPGAPTELIDSGTVEEYLAGGEFEETLSRLAQFNERQRNRPWHLTRVDLDECKDRPNAQS
jgi:hypothetical protein